MRGGPPTRLCSLSGERPRDLASPRSHEERELSEELRGATEELLRAPINDEEPLRATEEPLGERSHRVDDIIILSTADRPNKYRRDRP